MKTAILKKQEFEWISFNDFIEEIKNTTDKAGWVSYLPWHGMFHGLPFTHETDSIYLIGYGDGSLVRFSNKDVLCFTKENEPFLLRHPLAKFIDFKSQPDLLTDDMIEEWAEKEYGCPGTMANHANREVNIAIKAMKWARDQQRINLNWVISSLDNIVTAMKCDYENHEKVNPASIAGLNTVIEYLKQSGR
jgi:hypothetical protein